MDQNWFQDLFGFMETEENVRNYFQVEGEKLISRKNNRVFQMGEFSTPSISELKSLLNQKINQYNSVMENSLKSKSLSGPVEIKQIPVVGALELHALYPLATLQAASQFNCLEFASSNVIPEEGITDYVHDRTQGPACAVACAAGTVYRNYFLPLPSVNGNTGLPQYQIGQTENLQLNTLAKLEELVNNNHHQYWRVKNGYINSRSADNLEQFNLYFDNLDESQINELRDAIKLGWQRNVGVTFDDRIQIIPEDNKITVNQVYCSAVSCGYSAWKSSAWETLAVLVLEALYEGTLYAAAISMIDDLLTRAAGKPTISENTSKDEELFEHNRDFDQEEEDEEERRMNEGFNFAAYQKKLVTPKEEVEEKNAIPNRSDASLVFLTFVGGGVFANRIEWIAQAIGRAMALVETMLSTANLPIPLRIRICHYRRVTEKTERLIQEAYRNYREGYKSIFR
jgi:hypothetical protein